MRNEDLGIFFLSGLAAELFSGERKKKIWVFEGLSWPLRVWIFGWGFLLAYFVFSEWSDWRDRELNEGKSQLFLFRR